VDIRRSSSGNGRTDSGQCPVGLSTTIFSATSVDYFAESLDRRLAFLYGDRLATNCKMNGYFMSNSVFVPAVLLRTIDFQSQPLRFCGLVNATYTLPVGLTVAVC